MTEIKPCYAFMGASPKEQAAKITEEIGEVFEALKEYNQEPESIEKFGNLVDEIVDVQVAMETLLLILGLDDEGRDAARARIYEKNRRRGYYEKKVEGENEQSG